MGACCSMKTETRLIVLSLPLPGFFYLNFKKKVVYRVENESSFKISLPRFKVHKEFAIGLLADQSILIGGGVKKNGSLSKKVVQIYPHLQTLTKLPSLFRPIKKGGFYSITSTLYYISDNLSMPHQRLVGNKWELIECPKLELHSASSVE